MKAVSRMGELRVSRGLLLEYGGWTVLSILFFLFNYCLAWQTEKTSILLQIQSERIGILKIYWRSGLQGYMEERSVAVQIKPNIYTYAVQIPAPSRFSFLRIDPMDKPGRMVIERMVLAHSLCLEEEIDLEKTLKNSSMISGVSIVMPAKNRGISLQLTDSDPWFVIHPELPLNFARLGLWCVIAVLMGACLFVFLNQRLIKGDQSTGVLWLEDCDGRPADSLPWLTLINRHLTRVVLVKALETATSRVYCFSFASAGSENFHRFIADMHRHYPRLHIRTQFHRSSEV